MKTREYNNTKGTVLARHLIQSFLPGEVYPIKAHEIGMELCKKINFQSLMNIMKLTKKI